MRNVRSAQVTKVLGAVLIIVAAFGACRKDDPESPTPEPPGTGPTSPVVFDINAVPYAQLSTYNFFQGPMADQQPSYGVLPFEPISTLFTDYAKKKRFVWMPSGVKAQYAADGALLDFADGTVLIKNFYYDNVQPGGDRRIIETRLMFRRNGAWEFADYVWNAEQTEATFDLVGSNTAVEWVDDNSVARSIDYRIPSHAECATCHKSYSQPVPIGTKPQNLNGDFAYEDGSMNQLAKWELMGYLESGFPSGINTVVDYHDVTQDLEMRVRSYVDINCAHCHADGGHCDYRPMRFAFGATIDPVNLGVCVEPDDPIDPSQTHIVSRGNTARSMMYYRINSNDEAVRMPLFGRTIIHEEAVDMIGEWIDGLSPPCP
ncbi:MAG: hypothetical protein R2815_09845 [Flavobacteriales bacterium]